MKVNKRDIMISHGVGGLKLKYRLEKKDGEALKHPSFPNPQIQAARWSMDYEGKPQHFIDFTKVIGHGVNISQLMTAVATFKLELEYMYNGKVKRIDGTKLTPAQLRELGVGN